MSSRLKDLIARAEALSPGAEGVKELMRDFTPLPAVYRHKVYSAIAWSTGLTFDEIAEIDSLVRLEKRGVFLDGNPKA